MRVIHQTPDRLVLQERPWLLWLGGSMFTIVGAMVFTLGWETVSFQCDRSLVPPACTLTNQKLLTQRSITLPLQSLQKAEIQSSRSSKGRMTYRILLRTDSGGIPLVQMFDNFSPHTAQARQINGFLQNPNQSALVMTRDYRWFALLFLVTFSGPGMLMLLLLGKIVTLDLNKRTGECTLQRRGLLGQHQRHYPLRDIRRVWIECSRKKTNHTYRVNLDLRSGETVHLTPYLSSGYQDKECLRNRLCDFLNLEGEAPLGQGPFSQKLLAALANPGNLVKLTLGEQAGREKLLVEAETQMQLHPDRIEPYYQLAVILAVQGRAQDAKERLTQAKQQLTAIGYADTAQQLEEVIHLLEHYPR